MEQLSNSITPKLEKFNKIKVIIGPRSSGKSRKARELTKDKFICYFDGRKLNTKTPFMLRHLTENTEIILVEDIPSSKKFTEIFAWFCKQTLTINRPGRESFTIPRPEVILVCDFESSEFDDEFLKRRIDVIDIGLPENQYSDNVKSYYQIQAENELERKMGTIRKTVDELKKLSGDDCSLLIKIDGRFYYKHTLKRVLTAWSIAGAKLFSPEHLLDFQAHYTILSERGKNPEVCVLSISKLVIDTDKLGADSK